MRPLVLGLLGLALACSPDPGNDSASATTSGGPGTSTDAPTSSTTSASSASSSGASATTSTTSTSTGATTDASTGAGGSSSGAGSSSGVDTTTTDATGSTGGGGTTGGATGLTELGSLVVLGDSISDGGGQPPFYYDLLRADLEAKYGPLSYHNNAQSGSVTKALLGQAQGLPKQLPGPVAVVITSGGNDMKAALPLVILGQDGPTKQMVAANIDAALSNLLAPGRFGPGVEVFVFEGNVYDASDGKGNFSMGKCAFGQGIPAIPTDPFFDAWNGTIRDAVLAHQQDPVDMHMHFYGHGFNNPPNWYASDCTHPSTLGHDQLRRLFYREITGEDLP